MISLIDGVLLEAILDALALVLGPQRFGALRGQDDGRQIPAQRTNMVANASSNASELALALCDLLNRDLSVRATSSP